MVTIVTTVVVIVLVIFVIVEKNIIGNVLKIDKVNYRFEYTTLFNHTVRMVFLDDWRLRNLDSSTLYVLNKQLNKSCNLKKYLEGIWYWYTLKSEILIRVYNDSEKVGEYIIENGVVYDGIGN